MSHRHQALKGRDSALSIGIEFRPFRLGRDAMPAAQGNALHTCILPLRSVRTRVIRTRTMPGGKTPTSSCPRLPPTSSGSRAGRCWRRWYGGPLSPRCWPSLRGAEAGQAVEPGADGVTFEVIPMPLEQRAFDPLQVSPWL